VKVEKINPPTLAPPMGDLYAQIALAKAPGLAFISGQPAYRPDGELVGKADHTAQARQAFANLKAALEALGAKPQNMVRMTIYVVDYNLPRARGVFAAAREVFGDDWPVTSSVLLGVEALAMEDWLIEIDGIVAI
jgi:enamine deaminase RidA (YjgF/YER057c/UK114 family)